MAPVTLTLTTVPPGAEVVEGGAVLGTTPFQLPLEGQPQDAPRQFQLRLEGYATHTVSQPYTQGYDPTHHISLAPLPEPTVERTRVIRVPVPVPVPVAGAGPASALRAPAPVDRPVGSAPRGMPIRTSRSAGASQDAQPDRAPEGSDPEPQAEPP